MSEVLLEVMRGRLAENLIRGSVVVIDGEGKVTDYIGDPNYVTYMRSAAKPFQAAVAAEIGACDFFGINDKELAIMCGSHIAEEAHIDALENIMLRGRFKEDQMALPADYSLDKNLCKQRIAAQVAPRKLNHNCSGKHACMFLLCRFKGYPTANYYAKEHPIQDMIWDSIAAYTHMPKADIIVATDGCGVPVYGLPLYNMAVGYLCLTNPDGRLNEDRTKAAKRITKAMASCPQMVAGTGQFCTELIRVTNGRIIGKLGADGVFCCGVVGEDAAFAFKIEDGNMDAIAPVAMSVLKQLRWLSKDEEAALDSFSIIENINHLGEKVGETRPAFTLVRG